MPCQHEQVVCVTLGFAHLSDPLYYINLTVKQILPPDPTDEKTVIMPRLTKVWRPLEVSVSVLNGEAQPKL